MKYFVRIVVNYFSNDTFCDSGEGGPQIDIRTNLSNSSFDNIGLMIVLIFVHRFGGGVCVQH